MTPSRGINQGEADSDLTFGTVWGNRADRSLVRLVVRSLSWTAAARFAAAVGVVVRYVIFARLLRPYDFGVVGAANFCELLLAALTDPNLESALVVERENIAKYLDTVWVTRLAHGALVALALVLLAGPLANFFLIGHAYRVFWAIAPMALLMAAKSPAATARIFRNLDFRISFVLNACEQVFGFIAGLVALLWWRDWRGLLVALFAAQGVRTVLTFWYFPYRPRLNFEFVHALKMFAYGRWITVRLVFEFAQRNLDNLTVGHLLGASALGEYQMAFRLGEMPATEIADITRSVCYPLVAQLRGERKARERLFSFSVLAVTIVGLLYGAFIFWCGRPLIAMTVGAKWLNAVPPLKLLCIFGLLQGLISVGIGFLDGLRVPDASLHVTLVSAAALALLVYPLTRSFGTVGTAGAVVLSVLMAVPPMFKLYGRASVRIG